MAIQVAAPCIEVESVIGALEAMRQGRRLETTNPLTQFISIHHNAASSLDGFVAAEVRIFRHLAQLIRHQLNRHRQLYGLRPVIKGKVNAREDFKVGSAELEAWSTLYHRYIWVDLDWSVERLSQEVEEPERTLHRRQQLGMYRLTQRLAKREMRAREQENVLLMRANLPPIRPPLFIDRDDVLNWGWNRLTNIAMEPHHILLNGAPGIGKSVVAHRLASGLINELHVRSLVWIDQPDVILSVLYEQIVQELGLPLVTDARSALRSYYRQMNGLVVIDDAQVILEDERRLHSLLSVLEDARVILCAQTSSSVLAPIPTYFMSEFEAPSVQEFFDQLATIYPNKLPDEENLKTIYAQVGGNPRALWAAIDARQPIVAIAQAQYGAVWAVCSDEQRCLWILLTLIDEQNTSIALLHFIDESEVANLHDAIEPLVHQYVIEYSATDRISLLPLARTFAESILTQENLNDSTLKAINIALDLPSQHWSRTTLSHLLNILARLKTAASQHVHMAATFGVWALDVGAVEAWLRYNDAFKEQLPKSDRSLCLQLVGEAHARLGEWTESAYALTEAIEHAGNSGEFDQQAQAQTSLAIVLHQRGNTTAARSLLRQAEAYFQRQRDVDNLHRVYFALAQIEQTTTNELPKEDIRRLYLETQSAMAQEDFERALAVALQVKAQLSEAESNYPRLIALLGRIYFVLGDWSRAVESMRWSIRAFELREDIAAGQQARINLALMYAQRGKTRRALGELEALPAWTWEE